MSLAPVGYLARRLFKRHRSGEAAASEVVTICPAEIAKRPRAYFLPGQLDRVRDAQAMGGRDTQFARITEGEVTQDATRALCYRNATLIDQSLFAGGARLQMSMHRPPRTPHRLAVSLDSAALVGTPISSIFFGHYLMDDSATTLIAREFGPVFSPANEIQSKWRHAMDYRGLMDLVVPQLPDAFITKAWVFDDHGMNSHRRSRMQEVRRRLGTYAADQSGHAVFIIRGGFGQNLRLLENEMELAEALAQRGFVIVNPMEETVPDIIRKISGAALVISVEGSALTHAYLTMQQHGTMITLQPPYRFDNVWKDFTDLLGMKYGFVVGEGSRDRFRIDIVDVLRTMDLAIAGAGANLE